MMETDVHDSNLPLASCNNSVELPQSYASSVRSGAMLSVSDGRLNSQLGDVDFFSSPDDNNNIGVGPRNVHMANLPNNSVDVNKVVVIIKPTSVDCEESLKFLHDSNYRMWALKNSEFESCMGKIQEIKLNRDKKHVVVILRAGVDPELLNRLYNITMLGGCEVQCRGPNLDRQNVVNAVVSGYPYMTDVNNLSSYFDENNIKYRFVKRLFRYVKNVRVPDDNVLVGFEGYVPDYVLVNFCKYRIRPFEDRPIRCFKCQLFGHTVKNCKSTVEKCDKCGVNHNSRGCTLDLNKDRVEVRCANCGGNHPAFSKMCESYKKAVVVRRLQISENLSYAAALRRVSREMNERERGVGVTPSPVVSVGGLDAPGPSNRNAADRTALGDVRGRLADSPRPTFRAAGTQTESVSVSTQTDVNSVSEVGVGLRVVNDLSSTEGNLRALLVDCLIPALEVIPKNILSGFIYEVLSSCIATSGGLHKNSKKLIETSLLRCQAKISSFLLESEKKKRKNRSFESLTTVVDDTGGVGKSDSSGKKTKKVDG